MNIKPQIKATILLLVLITTLGSCGVFKNVERSSTSNSATTTVKDISDERTHQVVKGSGKTSEKDKGIITTERETTETTKRKGQSTEVKVSINDINKEGETTLRDSIGRSVILTIDKVTRTLAIKYDLPEEETTKTTKEVISEQRDFLRETSNDSELISTTETKATRDSTFKEKSKDATKTSTPSFKGVFALALGLILAIFILVYTTKKIKI